MSNSTKALKRALLATSCLTAIAGGAQAATINESTYGDFGNSFGTATVLPVVDAITQVNGIINTNDGPTDYDYFKLSGLHAGDTVQVDFLSSGFSSAYAVCGTDAGVNAPACAYVAEGFSFTAPASGMAGFAIQAEGDGPYAVKFTTTGTVPVAPSAALLGLGLAAMALRRRKHGSN